MIAEPACDRTHAVLNVLEGPEFQWRTIASLSAELGLEPELVKIELRTLADQNQVLRIDPADPVGDPLFTTRRAYRRQASFLARLGAALRNRAI